MSRFLEPADTFENHRPVRRDFAVTKHDRRCVRAVPAATTMFGPWTYAYTHARIEETSRAVADALS